MPEVATLMLAVGFKLLYASLSLDGTTHIHPSVIICCVFLLCGVAIIAYTVHYTRVTYWELSKKLGSVRSKAMLRRLRDDRILDLGRRERSEEGLKSRMPDGIDRYRIILHCSALTILFKITDSHKIHFALSTMYYGKDLFVIAFCIMSVCLVIRNEYMHYKETLQQ